MYGCSTAATLAASSSSSGEVDSSDLVDSVRERVAELSGSESTSSMDPSDIEEDPGYRVSVKKKKHTYQQNLFPGSLEDDRDIRDTPCEHWTFEKEALILLR